MGDQAMSAARIEPVVTPAAERRHGGNPVLDAARGLLDLASRLRLRHYDEALEPLRDRLSAMVGAFDAAVEQAGVDETVRLAARYCLCTFVDEIVAATPAGGAGAWASRSLLLSFHGETSGGERFFSHLHALSRDASAHLDALELIYVMLALGMEGRYRLVEGGAAQLEAVRRDLRRLVLDERGSPPQWPRPATDDASLPRGRWKAGGALAAGALLALALLLTALAAHLHAQARPVIDTLTRVRVVPAQPDALPTSATRATPALAAVLAQRLASDLSNGQLALDGGSDSAVLTLGSDGLFASGSAVVLAARVPLLRRIGAALRGLDARIVVAGHTDDEAPSRGRPSNWQLSLARATHVVDLLRVDALEPERFLAQGRGATEPIAPNDTPAMRARNRRVVISIFADSGTPS